MARRRNDFYKLIRDDRRYVLQSLFYVLSLVGFGVIALWLMQNDRLPAGERTIGLLRMRDTISPNANTRTKTKLSADV